MEIDELPFEVRWPLQRALAHWRRGDLDGARGQLEVALTATTRVDEPFARLHAFALRASVAYAEREYALARALQTHTLELCHELGYVRGMATALCDLAMIDLVEGDVDAAYVRFARGVACFTDGGLLAEADAARSLWASAAKATAS